MLTLKSSLSTNLIPIIEIIPPERDLASYPATYNLDFSKPTAYADATYNGIPFPVSNDVTDWSGSSFLIYKKNNVSFSKVINTGTDPEKGAIGFQLQHNNFIQWLTNVGFPLNAGTYYVTFRCVARGGDFPAPLGIGLDYSINNSIENIFLYLTGLPYYNPGGDSDMMHPSAVHTTPTFTIPAHTLQFRLRFTNAYTLGPTVNNIVFIDDIKIFKV